jgi:hypothetical protein
MTPPRLDFVPFTYLLSHPVPILRYRCGFSPYPVGRANSEKSALDGVRDRPRKGREHPTIDEKRKKLLTVNHRACPACIPISVRASAIGVRCRVHAAWICRPSEGMLTRA